MKKVWKQCKTVKTDTVYVGVAGTITLYAPSCRMSNEIYKELGLVKRMYKC